MGRHGERRGFHFPLEGVGGDPICPCEERFKSSLVELSDDWSGSSGRPANGLSCWGWYYDEKTNKKSLINEQQFSVRLSHQQSSRARLNTSFATNTGIVFAPEKCYNICKKKNRNKYTGLATY